MNYLNERMLILHYATHADALITERMYALDPELKAPFQMSAASLMAALNLRLDRAERIYKNIQQLRHRNLHLELEKQGIGFLTRNDPHYPVRLQMIYDPPAVLFYQGNLSILKKTSPLAVIGSRRPSPEAVPIIEELLNPIPADELLIVSGLAEGVDGFAHKWALKNNVATMAILGSGFTHIYPPSHTPLARSIKNENLILSEYPPETKPQRWHFPKRNRLISGISKAVLIVEANEKSGSMITANCALEQGREVLAVPGSPLKKQAAGCLRLIQEGAKTVMSAEDIIEEI
ncbi:DNA-processing protein DprA [Alteribacter keqinensis]|uniref:DNA-protecting protein DprA n=1 Tax=Alteribacter keqinensis TaxID=2483800 RepID=A0A3M7TVJ8_9BACI|nr:DNA-processing protein DprA [Alteribacter keqinensis]RNA69607.1 DNA-protecting protein DprA [Alteribacter keqinensis]